MTLFDQLQQLEQLHESGQLSREELDRAKRELLNSAPQDDTDCTTLTLDEAIAHDEDQVQTELARIDSEWEIEKRQYLITGQGGRTYVPTKGGALLQLAVCVAFGICWIVIDCWLMINGKAGVTVFSFLGPLIILFSIAQGLYFLTKARRYREAEAVYEQRRKGSIARNWRS